jgi:site-specific DNA recombinase
MIWLLTGDGVPCLSAHDLGRNPYRCGLARSKGAARPILASPGHPDRQVWNEQRKDEILLDVTDVALGHVARMRWNDDARWIYSDHVVHPPTELNTTAARFGIHGNCYNDTHFSLAGQ